jgi:tetratricopeptide (TPR) repeat protein
MKMESKRKPGRSASRLREAFVAAMFYGITRPRARARHSAAAAASRAAETVVAPSTHFYSLVSKPAPFRERKTAGIRRCQTGGKEMAFGRKIMSDKLRSLPILGFAFLLTASLACAENKNEAKKSYDSVVNKAARDLKDGKIDDAANDAQQAEKLDPNNPETANLLGIVASKKKDYPEAISQFNRALAENPKFYTAKFNLADTLMLQGSYDQARSVLEDLSQVDPKSEILQFRIALDYVLANQPDKAMALIDVMDFPGKTPAYYYARAAVWLKKGLVKDATQYSVNAHKYYTESECSYFVSVLREMGLDVSVL